MLQYARALKFRERQGQIIFWIAWHVQRWNTLKRFAEDFCSKICESLLCFLRPSWSSFVFPTIFPTATRSLWELFITTSRDLCAFDVIMKTVFCAYLFLTLYFKPWIEITIAHDGRIMPTAPYREAQWSSLWTVCELPIWATSFPGLFPFRPSATVQR